MALLRRSRTEAIEVWRREVTITKEEQKVYKKCAGVANILDI